MKLFLQKNMKLRYSITIIISFFALKNAYSDRVALCITATGNYLKFADELIQSMKPRFMKNHEVTYFIFTDQPRAEEEDVRVLPWKRFGWPLDTMNRTLAYVGAEDQLAQYDWIFASDADMLCIGKMGDEMLAPTVGVLHPGFLRGGGTFETTPNTAAYIPPNLRKNYFAGGLYGGSNKDFFEICRACIAGQNADAAQKFTAIWHDESHLNRYFAFHPPTKILGPDYCWPEHKRRPPTVKFLARDKNHAECRAL